MSGPALRLVVAAPDLDQVGQEEGTGWAEWLVSHLDPNWRPKEWAPALWLFTGDLGNDRTAAWPCRTSGCPSTTRSHGGRCCACRRALRLAGVSEEEFDRDPPRRRTRPVARSACSVTGCQGELLSNGLCFCHERAWRRGRLSLPTFIAQAEPSLGPPEPCLVAGCGRDQVYRRGLCWFHDSRLRRQHDVRSLSDEDLRRWVEAEVPRLEAHQFSLAPLSGLARLELLYALGRRDETPPPLDPGQVRMLVQRLAGATSLRQVDPRAVCESGGQQYNSAVRSVFRDLRRYLDRAWVAYAGVDPYAGDVWEVALLDLQSNGSRRWPATEGVVDFRPVELPWLREVVKDWARTTRPYLQGLREVLRACRAVSKALIASGREDPASLGAGDSVMVMEAIFSQRRSDASLYSANHRRLLASAFCEVIEHGRSAGLMAAVPDPFRPIRRRHLPVEDPNEDEVGKSLPETVIRQLDKHLDLLGLPGGHGSISGDDAKEMHRTILPGPARHRAPPWGGGEPQDRMRRGHRRPAQPDLRQPQGWPAASAPPHHLGHG